MRISLYQVRVFLTAFITLTLLSNTLVMAQGGQPQPTLPNINMSANPLLKPFKWRGIGPASMGGRIDDIAVVESNPYVYYVGFATSGIWKTTNNGTTFEPIFDTYPVSSIGDLAICQQNPNIIWVGTGEPNNRQSSTIGDGIYKSTDAGKTFVNVGLKDTQSIARVVCDPKDEKVVYVAALGHLFGANEERGIFKTTDGGGSWNKIKYVDENTGFTDLAIDPVDNRILYAASYQRRRAPWGFNGGGASSALWKTLDAGKTWTKLEGNGLPDNPVIGRIGLDVSRSNPNVIYAQIEVGTSSGTGAPEERPAAQLQRPTSPPPTSAQPAAANETTAAEKKTEEKPTETTATPPRRTRRRAQTPAENAENTAAEKAATLAKDKKSADKTESVKGETAKAKKESKAKTETAKAEKDAKATTPAQAAQTPPQQLPQPASNADPTKSGVWRSDDKGKTWRVMSNNNNRPMYYSQIRVDPKNDQIVYTCGAPFHKSTDAGKTFKVVQGIAHSDHHAVWIDPNNSNHLIIGNDGGLDVTYDQCETWEFINTIAASQFYAVSADMRRPYYVCGGLQDNGSWCGPSATRSQFGIMNSEWYRVGGGDGFYTQIDPTDYTTVYAESQNGAVNRIDLKAGRTVSIRPRAARPRPNPSQTATGANPEAATPPTGQAPAGGQGRQGGGGFGGGFGGPTTSNIIPAPPAGEQYRFNWSTPVVLSPHNPRTIYVGANRLFKSVDRGDTWRASPDLTKQLDRSNLPIMGVGGKEPMASKHDGVANYSNITAIAESPAQAGVLWVGTDDGNVQVSLDGGATWNNVAKNIQDMPQNNPQISRVEPSRFEAAVCYVAIDNHRNNDFKPYLFVTRDFGATWMPVMNNLPLGNVNCIREDAKNKNLLYAATEFGFYVSLDAGATWQAFMNGLPVVRVDDIFVHPRDNDLIIATHGRGIYIMDDITPLQQLSEKMMSADVHLFDVRPGVQWLNDITMSRSIGGAKNYRAANAPPGTAINYYLKGVPEGEVKIQILDIAGKPIRNLTGTKEVGINRVQWNLRGDTPPRPAGFNPQGGGGQGGGFGGANFQPPVAPGSYLIKLMVGDKEYTTRVEVLEDIWKEQ
ncbi:MAG: hypothetical protein AB1757_13530 [Acidobacteriota bacterium]